MTRYEKQLARFETFNGLDEAFMTGLLRERDRLVSNLTGAFSITHEERGGWRRILCLSNAVFPASGVTHYVLDSSLDYRDRILFFTGPIDLRADTIVYPGHPDDGYFNVAPTIVLDGRCYYTGAGYAEPTVTGTEYWHFRSSEEILVYADIATGALKLTLIGGGAGTGQLATLGMLFVSPRFNEAGLTAVADVPLFDTLNGEIIEPHDLNNAQDHQHMEQTQAGDCLPLGPVLDGDPPLARVWTVRGEEKRQPITNPQLRRFVSFRCDAGETRILDRAFDWRDRIIHIAGCFSETVERRPGEAGDTLAGSFAAADTDPTAINGYTGPGSTSTAAALGPAQYQHTNAATPGFFYADESTGWLMFSMVGEVGNIETFNALIFASPQLGPRSGMRNPRLFEDPSLGKVGTPIADSVATDLVGIVARYRADRGTALDGGMVAGIADQTGNGHHLVQTDPTKRLFAPGARVALNSAEAWGNDTQRFMETVKALPAATDGYYVAIVMEVTAVSGTFEPFEQLLALTSEGSLATEIAATDVRGRWQPNATATPDYETEEATNYATGLIGIAWMWSVDGGDAQRLLPEVAVRDSVGIAAGAITTTSPAATGVADVQSTIWRMLEGIDGHIAEIVICNAAQSAVDDFLTSADVVTRYGF